jgi:outer membrane protein assembly factor BamB
VHQLNRSIPQVVTPVARGGMLFVVSDRGVVTCCDVASGKVHWTERIGGNYFSSPVVAGDKLYCVSAAGEAVALSATDHYKLLGRSELGEATEATPAIHAGRMYLRTETSLACLAP